MDRRISQQILIFVTILIIVGGSMLYQPVAAQPSCTSGTDSDSIANAMDVDDDDDGLIEICTADGLDAIRHQLDGSGYRETNGGNLNITGCASGGCKGYELTADIDLSGITNWDPIAREPGSQFNTTLEGNGHTISNLKIDRESIDLIGLIGRTGGSSNIENIHLSKVEINGRSDVGALVGTNTGKISNSSVVGDNIDATSVVGGLVGGNSGTIANSYTNVAVTIINLNAGGLVGQNRGNIFNSYALGTVTGVRRVGGLVGENNLGSILNSYARGAVTGTNRVGGFIGLLTDGSITNSYARGAVTGNNHIGGFIGLQERLAVGNSVFQTGGSITRSYATGRVRGSGTNINHIGGFIGGGDIIPANITHSYWDRTTNSGLVGVGGSITFNNNTSRTTVELQRGIIGETGGIYAAWSRSDWFGGGGYPALKYAKGSDTDPACDTNGQPRCGSLTNGQLIYALTGLTISKVRESTNLLNFDIDTNEYLIKITPDVNRLKFTPQTFEGLGTVRLDGSVISNSTTTELNFAPSVDKIQKTITVEISPDNVISEYTINIYRIGSCNATNLDEDGDGLIEICWLLGLNAMRYQLRGHGYKIDPDTPLITDGCDYNNSGRCRGYELMRNFDLDGINWQPIGDNDTPFAAIFEGNRHTISNLKIMRPSEQYIGLFGYAKNSTISTVSLSKVSTVGTRYVGSLVGKNEGLISNTSATGSVGSSSPSNRIGGLVGEHTGTITNSYAGVMVTGNGNYIGGLVGIQIGGEISNSYTSGNVNNNNADGTNNNTGGFVGGTNGEISNSYASGDVDNNNVRGNNNNTGGFVGSQTDGEINNSYASGDVNDNNTGGFSNGVGGFVGSQTDGEINNSYATGNVNDNNTLSGSNIVGGFVGRQQINGSISNSYAANAVSGNTVRGFSGRTSNINNISDSYWDAQLNGINASAGGTAQTTGRLKRGVIGEGIYEKWSADNWFGGSNSDYPVLRYAKIDQTNPACGESGQPQCGELLSEQNILALKTLVISKVGTTQNLLKNFMAQVNAYTVLVTPDTTRFNIILEPYSDAVTVSVNNLQLSGLMTEIQLEQSRLIIPITISSKEGLTHIYDIVIQQVGFCDTEDVDADNDSLIEICWPLGLDAIRYQLDGSGYKASVAATKITTGCATGGCKGYELMQDLDLGESIYKENWLPIGDDTNPFIATFEGNTHSLSNLKITTSTQYVGLFGYTRNNAITAVALLDVDIHGGEFVGGLVGRNDGTIGNSYITGTVRGDNSVGGLAGSNHGDIFNSYTKTNVSGNNKIGGLVGEQQSGTIMNNYADGVVISGEQSVGGFIGTQSRGIIENAYATGNITSNGNAGGFVGTQSGGEIKNSYTIGSLSADGSNIGGFSGSSVSIADSYWDRQRSKIATSSGGTSKTSVELQQGKIGESGGIYQEWSTDNWFSGTDNDYPILRYTEGNDAGNPLCGGQRPECDAVLGEQFTPLNTLILQSGVGTPLQFSNESLNPAFHHGIHEYQAMINPIASHIRFVIASPTTRTVSYQIDDGSFITAGELGSRSITLPLRPIPLAANRVKKVIIKVDPAPMESNQDATFYSITVERQPVFVQLRLLLEGAVPTR